MLDDSGNVVGTSKVAARHVRGFFRVVSSCVFVVCLNVSLVATGAPGDGPDPSGPTRADPDPPAHHHVCAGKVVDTGRFVGSEAGGIYQIILHSNLTFESCLKTASATFTIQ